MESISQLLKKRRLRLGLTLTQVARKSGTSVSALSRYENGWHRFELVTLQKIASSLGCRLTLALVPIRDKPESAARPSAKELAARLGRLFWDRRLKPADLETYSRWIVQRVLEYGELEDVQALMRFMGREKFLQTVADCRFTSKRTAAFWKNMLVLEAPACMKSHCRLEAGSCWIT